MPLNKETKPNLDLHSITDRLSNVEPSIMFIYELESNNTPSFFLTSYSLGILKN